MAPALNRPGTLLVQWTTKLGLTGRKVHDAEIGYHDHAIDLRHHATRNAPALRDRPWRARARGAAERRWRARGPGGRPVAAPPGPEGSALPRPGQARHSYLSQRRSFANRYLRSETATAEVCRP